MSSNSMDLSETLSDCETLADNVAVLSLVHKKSQGKYECKLHDYY